MSGGVRIRGVGTAVPKHGVPQAQARAFAAGFFAADFPGLNRLLTAFDHTGIEQRYLARPVEWYMARHSFAEKNAVYCEVAIELAIRAAEIAIARSGLAAEEIGTIVFVSTTGVRTPSIDGLLIQRLGLRRSTARVPVWGLGCAGGAAGLARATDLVVGTRRPVLLVAVELCSTTLVHGDRSKSNLIATALFGDGAAAAVLAPEGPGMAVLASRSELLDDTEDVMGWIVGDEGLEVQFAKSIPSIVREVVPDFVACMLADCGAVRSELEHFIVHPGGSKVLDAYEQALGLGPSALDLARQTLRDYGNMSSVTALFVLEKVLSEVPPRGRLGVVLGLGPGFSAEGVMVRW